MNKIDGMYNEVISFKQLPPLALYIHMPWCVKKCSYCDFNSHQLNGSIPQDKYIDALIHDFDQILPMVWGRTIKTVFIGGGTPSLFRAESIDRLLLALRSRLLFDPFAEVTIEANPGAIDNDNLVGYKYAGVNRVSFGVQSFNPKHLQRLGRIHTVDDIFKAIGLAKDHFEPINIDLMYGIMHQTIDELENDLMHALSFKPQHISYYNLTIEPNTYFAKHNPDGVPDNDRCYEMQTIIQDKLAQNNYNQYEVSAYSLDGYQCLHNLNYWQFGDYIGIGAGAHSKISMCDKIIRQIRKKQPKQYMQDVDLGKHILQSHKVDLCDIPFEFALNLFRLIDGFNLSLYTERTGIALNTFLPKLMQCAEDGFINLFGTKVVPTQMGKDFLNDLLLRFL